MSLRDVVDRIVVWVRKVEDAGPDPYATPRRCPNPDHTATDVIATRHGTVLRHWCTECGADLITPRGRIYGEGEEATTRPLADILDDMRENLRRLEELALYNHPDPRNGHTNGHTGELGSPHEDEV